MRYCMYVCCIEYLLLPSRESRLQVNKYRIYAKEYTFISYSIRSIRSLSTSAVLCIGCRSRRTIQYTRSAPRARNVTWRHVTHRLPKARATMPSSNSSRFIPSFSRSEPKPCEAKRVTRFGHFLQSIIPLWALPVSSINQLCLNL